MILRSSVVALMLGVAPSAAFAGFELRGTQQAVAAPVPVVETQPLSSSTGSAVVGSPMVISPLVPDAVPASGSVSNIPVSNIQATAPALPGVVNGFGSDMPLGMAVLQIVPSDRMVTFGAGVDQGKAVSWQGGRYWRELLADVATANGLTVRDIPGGVEIATVAAIQPIATVAVVAPAEPPPPLPLWEANRGEMLQEVLRRWCQKAGVVLKWNADVDFLIEVPIAFSGEFTEAAKIIITGQEGPPRPYSKLYRNDETGTPVLVVSTRGKDYYGE